MYYLQSRYYDPVVGRFINADGYVSTGQGLTGYNMFAYCGNSPVMYVDYSGHRYTTTVCLEGGAGGDFEDALPYIVHMYISGQGSNASGKINVVFSPYGENPSFKIYNSYWITDEEQQRLILEYIRASEYYSQDVFGRTVNSMLIEWDMHNDHYYSNLARLLDDLLGMQSVKSAQDVDFDKNSEGLGKIGLYWKSIMERWNK